MTVRVVVAVLAALVLVAAVQPALDHARDTRDAAQVSATTDQVVDAVGALSRRSSPGRSLATAPRRTVAVDLPSDVAVLVRADPPRLLVRGGDGAEHRLRLAVRVAVCGDRVTLRGDTTFAYVETVDGPVVLALRGFISESGTTGVHACAARTHPVDRWAGVPV